MSDLWDTLEWLVIAVLVFVLVFLVGALVVVTLGGWQ